MPITPSHASQDAEAAARAASKTAVPPGETAQALDVVGDVESGDSGARTAPAALPKTEQPSKEIPVAQSAFDKKRSEINARFRTERNTEIDQAKDEVTEFTRSHGLPPEFQQLRMEQAIEAGEPTLAVDDPEPTPEPVEAAPQGEEPDEAPRTIKLKVHGKEVELSMDDVVAKAQIALASENILEEAKSKSKELDSILAQARDRAARPAQDGPNQSAQSQTPSPENAPQPSDPNQIDKKLVELIQFGDPEEAEAAIQNTIEARAKRIVDQTLLESRLAEEGARAAKVLKDFEDANTELAQDPRTRAVIETMIYEQQRDDLKSLGLDPEKIRPDGAPTTPADIANAHRFYRAQGYSVKSPKQMLEKARDDFLDWKGVKKQTQPAGEQPAPKLPPKVDVTIDRAARRQAIPQQPSRSTAPTRQPAQATPQARDRSSIVAEEKARRAKLRGQQLGM